MRPLRIAYVAPGLPERRDEPGMPGVVDALEQVTARHDAVAVALRHPPARAPYRLAGVEVQTLGLGQRRGPVAHAEVLARGIARVVRLHRRRPVDLVHAWFAGDAGAVAAVAGGIIGRPVVVSVLGGELVSHPDIGYGGRRSRGAWLPSRLALRLADRVIVGSDLAASFVVAGGRRQVDVMPLGIDLEAFRPAPDRSGVAAPGGPSEVLFAGSLEAVKDPLAAVRVFARVAQTRPHVRLSIAGDGSLTPAVQRLARELGILGRVRFLGRLDRAAMPDAYRAAACLLVTSRHEGQMLSAVEAAACGLPVVGTRVGALPELGAGAVTCPVGDEDGLARQLGLVLDDRAIAASMSAAAVAAASRYGLGRTGGALLELYDELVRTPSRRGSRGGR